MPDVYSVFRENIKYLWNLTAGKAFPSPTLQALHTLTPSSWNSKPLSLLIPGNFTVSLQKRSLVLRILELQELFKLSSCTDVIALVDKGTYMVFHGCSKSIARSFSSLEVRKVQTFNVDASFLTDVFPR